MSHPALHRALSRPGLLAFGAAGTLTLAAAALHAGPLSPPAGPVVSTYKTLTDVEPRIAINSTNTPGDADSLFKITQPGSYYVTAALQGVAGKAGIEIAASNVTIDLKGFTLTGVPGSLSGIRTSVYSLDNIQIINGALTRWGNSGIDLVTYSGSRQSVRDVRSSSNSGAGVRIYNGAVARNCAADANGGIGFDVYTSITMSHCTATGNAGNGFDTASFNNISDCSAMDNSGIGFSLGGSSSISACLSTNNIQGGISILSGDVTNCTTISNGSTYGINAQDNTTILGNTCSNQILSVGLSTGIGIYISGYHNRIEGNHCTGNGTGYNIHGHGNLVIKNTASNNGLNWTFNDLNVYGPIVDRTSIPPSMFSGNSAPSTLGTTDANANFTY